MRRECFAAHWDEFDTGLERALCWRGRNYAALLPKPLSGADKDVCPAFVFALTSGSDLRRRDIVELALSVEYTYLSFRVHRFIREIKSAERERQYSVLFGDFFSAKVLTSLSGDLLYPQTCKYTEVMRTMNEGALLRRRLPPGSEDAAAWREVLLREKAALLLPARVIEEWRLFPREETQGLEGAAAELAVLWGAGEEGKPDLLRAGLAATEKAIAGTPPGLRENLRSFFLDLTAGLGARA
ncbi:MAG: hypothetical protein LBH21_00700 [Gracilibacteraceae bacterium]|jgi:hypothetical protein|nr:hypothetical protein [Gracilibacteraceae bacterium]